MRYKEALKNANRERPRYTEGFEPSEGGIGKMRRDLINLALGLQPGQPPAANPTAPLDEPCAVATVDRQPTELPSSPTATVDQIGSESPLLAPATLGQHPELPTPAVITRTLIL